MRLVVGPTCAGKSTLIEQWKKDAADQGRTLNLHYAHSLDSSALPDGPDDVIHLNLLRGYELPPFDPVHVNRTPLLPELVDAADEITVLTSPSSALRQRATERFGLEPDRRYARKVWLRALRAPVLAQIYEHLALHLDQSGKPHQYLCSGNQHGGLHPISRWEFPRLALPKAPRLCQRGHPEPDLDVAGNTYQADYRDRAAASARAATLSRALRMPLNGKRVLDVGCAEGAAALSAFRMGAKVTGIEPRTKRFRQATAISAALSSRINLRNIYLDQLGAPPGSFDVVLALNVAHHVPDPLEFLNRLAELSSEYLVVEYPGLGDRKYRASLDEEQQSAANALVDELPLFGVSSSSQDQTFVFSPAGLERYLVDILGAFSEHELLPSPKRDRWISVFSHKNPGMTRQRLSIQSQMAANAARQKAEVERLNQVIRDMRNSRSWRLTAPLRGFSALVRRRLPAVANRIRR